jgi:perosamine synthetase
MADSIATEDAPLAIDGGEPLLRAPFPAVLAVQPAGDAEPARALERELAARLDLPPGHVVAVRDAATAYRALIEAGVAASEEREAPEVIVPALLGAEAARAALRQSMPVVPCEVDAYTAAIAPRGLVRSVGPQTAVVVAVHPFGHPAPVDELARAVDGHDIAIVEDASEALGASLRGVPAGRMAEAGIFAFGAGRLLTGGKGASGALLVLRTLDRAEQVRRAHGDLDVTAARVALSELRRSDEELEARRQIAWELTFNLRGAKGLVAMPHSRWIRHGYARYVMRLRGMIWRRTLDETIAAIRAEGVPCERACGIPLHLDPAVRAGLADDERLSEDGFAVAATLAEELIAIPLHGGLTARDMEHVARVLRHVERWSLA